MKYKYKNFGNVARWAYSSNELYQKKNCMTNRQYVTDAFFDMTRERKRERNEIRALSNYEDIALHVLSLKVLSLLFSTKLLIILRESRTQEEQEGEQEEEEKKRVS